jgi:hypothetical protein
MLEMLLIPGLLWVQSAVVCQGAAELPVMQLPVSQTCLWYYLRLHQLQLMLFQLQHKFSFRRSTSVDRLQIAGSSWAYLYRYIYEGGRGKAGGAGWGSVGIPLPSQVWWEYFHERQQVQHQSEQYHELALSKVLTWTAKMSPGISVNHFIGFQER